MDVVTLLLLFARGDAFCVFAFAPAVPIAPVLTGLCRDDDCLGYRL